MSSWYRQQHGIQEPLFLAAARIQRRKGVGKPQKVGTAILLGSDQRPQRIGVAAGLQQHGRVNAVQCGGIECLKFGIAVKEGLLSAAAVPWLRRGVKFWEELLLQVGIRVVLNPVGSGTGAIFSEEFPGPLGHRQQAHHALFLADDVAGPGVEVDAHRLGEAAHYVEREG